MSKPVVQEEMIDQVRRLCHQDKRITAALMYGSFTTGEGDEFSDIEFYIFINNADSQRFNHADWVGQIAPVALYFVSHLGHERAIFENLVRGEFHFQRASEMASIRQYKQFMGISDPDSMLILDRTGELRSHLNFLFTKTAVPSAKTLTTQENILWLSRNFMYSMLSGFSLLARDERAHALDTLGVVHRFFLPLVREHEGKVLQGETRASRRLKKDLSGPVYDRYIDCTGGLHHDSLERAYWATWLWGKEIMENLMHRHDINVPEALVQSLNARFIKILESQKDNLARSVISSGGDADERPKLRAEEQ